MTGETNDTSRWTVVLFVPIQRLSKMKECVIWALVLTGQMNSQGTEVYQPCRMFLSTQWYIYRHIGRAKWVNTFHEMAKGLTFNIWCVSYVLLWITCWFIGFASHSTPFLFTFYLEFQPFWELGFIKGRTAQYKNPHGIKPGHITSNWKSYGGTVAQILKKIVLSIVWFITRIRLITHTCTDWC